MDQMDVTTFAKLIGFENFDVDCDCRDGRPFVGKGHIVQRQVFTCFERGNGQYSEFCTSEEPEEANANS